MKNFPIFALLTCLAFMSSAEAGSYQWIQTTEGVEFSWTSEVALEAGGARHEALLRVTNLTAEPKDVQFRMEFMCSTGPVDVSDTGKQIVLRPFETQIGTAAGLTYRTCSIQGGYPMRAYVQNLRVSARLIHELPKVLIRSIRSLH